MPFRDCRIRYDTCGIWRHADDSPVTLLFFADRPTTASEAGPDSIFHQTCSYPIQIASRRIRMHSLPHICHVQWIPTTTPKSIQRAAHTTVSSSLQWRDARYVFDVIHLVRSDAFACSAPTRARPPSRRCGEALDRCRRQLSHRGLGITRSQQMCAS